MLNELRDSVTTGTLHCVLAISRNGAGGGGSMGRRQSRTTSLTSPAADKRRYVEWLVLEKVLQAGRTVDDSCSITEQAGTAPYYRIAPSRKVSPRLKIYR